MVRCKECYVLVDDILMDILEDDPLTISFEVQEVIYEMTLRYQLEKPNNVLQFCYNYMNRLLKARHTTIIYAERQPDDILGESYWQKREAVVATHPNEDDEIPTPCPKSADEVAFITKSLVDTFPFKYLDNDTFRKVVGLMYPQRITTGQHITVQGEMSYKFFLIEEGQYTASVTDEDYTRNVKTFEDSGYFSLASLLYDYRNEETVFANSEGKLWVLEQEAYRGAIVSAARDERQAKKELLSQVPVFRDLTVEEMELLADSLSVENYADGERVTQEGDLTDNFYLVLDGRVVLSRQDPSSRADVKLRELQRGDFFGEHVLLTIDLARYSARASADSRLALLKVDAFESLFGPCQMVMQRDKETYQQRLNDILGEEKYNLRPLVM